MPTLSEARIAKLLAPYLGPAPASAGLLTSLSTFLDLLLRWNARTNLTAITEPETIVERHFGESLFAARHLASRLTPNATLLDFGSGAGFPGIPIQLYLPGLKVTLAESQGKKAAFLREAVRTLNLTTEVWDRRVEDMPADRHFDCITLRAVDKPEAALASAKLRILPSGVLALLGSDAVIPTLRALPCERFPIPGTQQSALHVCQAL